MRHTLITLIILTCLSFKCTNFESKFINDNIKSIRGDVKLNKLKFSGVYLKEFIPMNKNDNHPIFSFTKFLTFFSNGFCTNSNLFAYSDSLIASNQISKINSSEVEEGGGCYSLNSNGELKLLVRILTTKQGGRLGYAFTLFEGKINTSSDTVYNFKMIKPFPKYFNYSDTMPRKLVFHEFPIKSTLDSNNYYIKKFIK